jgi:hypothetical protein
MQAIAALSGLRSLDFFCLDPLGSVRFPFPDMQQLTYLQLRPIGPWDLSCLQPLLLQPRKLQQLHMTVAVCFGFQELYDLADWIKQHLGLVSSLKVEVAADFDYSIVDDAPDQLMHERMGARAVIEAVQEAAAAAAAEAAEVAAAAAVAAATTLDELAADLSAGAALPPAALPAGLRLQSFSIRIFTNEPDVHAALMRALPASSLTHVECPHSWCDPAQVSALCRLTGLQSCVLPPRFPNGFADDDALAQLTALQQLTRLELTAARKLLQRLPLLPQLQVLDVFMNECFPKRQLQLVHLTCVTKLVLQDRNAPLLASDQLPPSLHELVLLQEPWSERSRVRNSFRLQPLLALQHLKKLHLQMPGTAGAAAELAQLGSVSSLQELRLNCSVCPGSGLDSSAASAWSNLPLKSLAVSMDEVSAGFVQQLTMFGDLTCLSLTRELGAAYEPQTHGSAVTPAQLAVVLTQLTGLQALALDMRMEVGVQAGSLSLHGLSTAGASSSYLESLGALLQAIGGLQQLGTVQFRLPVELDAAALQHLSGMLGHLLPSSLVAHCKVAADLLSIVA